MPLFAVGINHTTAPVAIREQLAFNAEQAPLALDRLAALPGVHEGLLVSTCNRTELYCALDDGAGSAVTDWLVSQRAPEDPGIRARLYTLHDDAAIRHLLRVACGLDSMVLGEPQILGQLKQAYQLAADCGHTGPLLHRLFQHAFTVAKQVRTDTSIGASPVSVAFAAVNLARQIFGDFRPHTALLIGAGETIELAARYLHDKGLGRMIIANRTPERAQALAAPFNAYAIRLDEIPAHLGEADIVIASTASPDLILARAQVERATQDRRHKPVFMVDLAVPRDIDPAIGDLEDIYLYSVDDLHGVIKDSLDARRTAAREAEQIVETRVTEFSRQLRTLDAVPAIQDLRASVEQLRARTLEQAQRMLNAGRPANEVLEFLAQTLSNRILHTPTARLREAAQAGDLDIVQIARRLFDLPE